MKNYPHIQQHDERDCGAACLSMIATYFGLSLPIAKYRELIKIDHMGANMYGLTEGAKAIGFMSDPLEGSIEELMDSIQKKEFDFPFIARIINEIGYEHYIVIWELDDKTAVIGDPGKTKTTQISAEDFTKMWQGQIVTFSVTSEFKKGNHNKGAFSRYFEYVFRQKKMFVFVIFMSIIITFINIVGASTFQYVIQSVQSNLITNMTALEKNGIYGRFGYLIEKIFPTLGTMCIIVVLFFLMKGIISIIRDWTLFMTIKKVDIPITMGYYRHLMDLPMEFFNTRRTGDFMKRFNDAGEIRNAISAAVLSLVLDTIMAVGCGIFLCWLNVYMFIAAVLLLSLYIVYILVFKTPMKTVKHDLMRDESLVMSNLKETIDGIETIKSYNYVPVAKEKTNTLYSNLLNVSIKSGMMENVQRILISLTEEVGTVLILAVGCIMCNKKILSLSELFVFYYMMSFFIEPVKNLVSLQPTIQSATVAAERLNDITDAEKEADFGDPVKDLKGDITFDNVNFRYGNHECILNDFSLTIPQGSKVALIGESGCGKTTITKLLMSFYHPESGNILINGTDIQNIAPSELRKHISYISQNTFLLADTIYENLRMGDKSITNEEIKNMCKKCAANDFIEKLPAGYETVLEENGQNLSGGQRQKLAIARALLRKPDIFIMDEATSNLDSLSEQIIQKLVDEQTKDITVIVIAHRLNIIKKCDIIYLMENGAISDLGTHEELMKQSESYAKIWKYGNE